jgi:hypothetical protein
VVLASDNLTRLPTPQLTTREQPFHTNIYRLVTVAVLTADALLLASHSGPGVNAGMVTIGKMGVSPSGRMVDFFFRTLPGGVNRTSSEETGGPNLPGSKPEGLGGVAKSVGNRAASILRDGERCRRGEGRVGGAEGDRIRCGDAGGEERGDEEQE